MKEFSDRAAQNLDNLENFTKPLGERGPQIVDNLDGSLANINELLEQLVTFTDNLNSREGTLGRILNDDQLYLRLDRTLANAEDITAQSQADRGRHPHLQRQDRPRSQPDSQAPQPARSPAARRRHQRHAHHARRPRCLPPRSADHVEGDGWDPVIVP